MKSSGENEGEVAQKAEARERALREEAEALNEVALTLAAELDLETLVQKVTDTGTELTCAAFGSFFYNTVNEKGEAYLLYTLSGAPREAFATFGMPRNTKLFGPTFRGEGVIRVADVLQDPRYGKNPPHHGMPKGHLPVRSYLAAPVVSRSGEVLGGLFFGHPEPGVFTVRAERIALGIAAQAAIAIDNARLYGQAQKEIAERKRAEVLQEDQMHVLRLIAGDARLSEVLEALLRTIEHQSRNGLLGSILLIDQDGVHLRHGAAPNLPEAYNRAIDGLAIGPDVGSCGTAAYLKKPVYVSDIENDPLWVNFRDLALSHGLRSCWSTPIFSSRGEVLGLFAMYYCHVCRPDNEDLKLVELATRTATIAIDRRQAAEALRQSEERYRLLFDSAPIAVFVCDLSGVIQDYNRLAETFWGRAPERGDPGERYCGSFKLYRLDGTLLPHSESPIVGVLSTGIPARNVEVFIERPNGSRIPVIVNFVPLKDDGGVVIGSIASFDDITERLQSEKVVRRSHQQIEALVRAAPVGMYMVDAEMRICQVNPKAEPVFAGIEGLIGHDFVKVIHILWSPEVVDRVVGRFRHTLETGEPYFNPEFSEERRDSGVREYYDWQIHRIPLPDGQFGVVCYFSDISGHVRARQALAESEQRLRFMAESMPQKIFTAKPNGDVDYFNHQWIDYTGLSFEDIRDWGWTQFVHPDDLAANVASWQRSIETGQPFEFEQRFRHHDGAYRWHVSRAHALRDAEGGVVMWIGSNTDVDALKRSEEERQRLYEAERCARMESEKLGRLKDEFLATLSHELRTPLNAILGWTYLLGKDVANEAIVRHGLEVIERSARGQAQLVADLLDMSRIISGKMRLDVQTVELPPVVEAAVDGLRPAAEAKGVQLLSILKPVNAPVLGDPSRLQQIVWNLVSNAVKFTPRGGSIRIVLARLGSDAQVTVSDTGKGIEPEFVPLVFQRFRQADSSSGREHGGLGLGLAIVKELAELHGGSVRAESGGEGQGATFFVRLPLAVMSATAKVKEDISLVRKVAARELYPPLLNGVRILVVDDDPDARELIRRLLEACEAEVLTAGSVDEGIAAFRRDRFDVVLSDIAMPLRDGYEFIAALRKTGSAVPAAALTALARSEDRTRALASGFQAHISKPVEPTELIAMVASLAGRPAHGAASSDGTLSQGAP